MRSCSQNSTGEGIGADTDEAENAAAVCRHRPIASAVVAAVELAPAHSHQLGGGREIRPVDEEGKRAMRILVPGKLKCQANLKGKNPENSY